MMLNLKSGVALATVAVAGGFATYRFFKSRNNKGQTSADLPRMPFTQEQPTTISESQPVRNKPITAGAIAGAALAVGATLQTTVAALKTTVIAGTFAIGLGAKLLATAVTTKPNDRKTSIFAPGWIISRNDDLIYLIGSVGVSLAMMYATFVWKVNPIMLWWLWALVLDGPHIWGTATRTYLDKAEWGNRKQLLLGSLVWFGLGGLFATLNLSLFRTFAYTWAYYHLVKQHYGFMVLYKKKNNDLAQFDNFIDKAMIWVGFSYPFITAMFKPDSPDTFRIVSQVLPKALHAPITKLTWWTFLATLGTYAVRQLYKLNAQLSFDAPKHLLLAASIGLHIAVMALPYGQLANGLLLIVATLTAYHNVQYQRLMWFHNRNKYGKESLEKTRQEHGVAAYFGRNFWFYLGSGLLFTLFYRPVLLKKARHGKYAAQMEGFFWGFAFLHYYLDSKIWHVRRDNKLNQALKMNGKPATA